MVKDSPSSRERTVRSSDARQLVTANETDLGRQLTFARVLLLVLGLTLAVGQVLPLGTGWLLLRPELARAIMTHPSRETGVPERTDHRPPGPRR
jgi:hypothetical protein